ncbi:aldo/keto reductase [Sphingobacterium sp. DK4209]|uniref:Aldo/keto reductase n=1 Tax=Sphingobacterium zhuxiongii TaxID=2662364 RepID=A0A5Q0QA30_9SPHI|nr:MULTISPECIES: aldo/keto reductase [unclassified Sphingobacterium]MVZ66716.1 aldo/keto reductase [Sphingobacterium sp. DK4209]QGA26296.1 aldo/keto reductase [Sphingobacterium sp. dk4302]
MENKRQIADSELFIDPIIFGGNVFGWTLDEKASFDILDRFVDLGFNAIDTANNYSHWVPGNKGGESEAIIGSWLQKRNKRDDLILMTKVGGRFGYDSKPNTKASYIKEQVELSLQRLQTDYIDLYQTHYDDIETPLEETLRAYEDLIKEGKVRYIGASNITGERLEESLSTSERLNLPKYISLQPEYNLYDRAQYERDYEVIAAQNNLAVIPYYSLASGFLSGKYLSDDDFNKSARGEGIQKRYWNERGQQIVKALSDVAAAYRTTSSSVALAWLLARPSITAPIASATKEEHLQSFVTAVQLRLGEDAIQKLNEASAY